LWPYGGILFEKSFSNKTPYVHPHEGVGGEFFRSGGPLLISKFRWTLACLEIFLSGEEHVCCAFISQVSKFWSTNNRRITANGLLIRQPVFGKYRDPGLVNPLWRYSAICALPATLPLYQGYLGYATAIG
jgi:hypothetical protein